MARIEFLNAILTGKLGGSVYSRNKAGYYVRGYAKPTNPQTGAQMSARAFLGAVSSAWHSLTDVSKAAWNTFAITDFKPKFGLKSGVTYSGFNAFASLLNVQQNMIAMGNEPNLPANFDISFNTLTPVFQAPALSMSAFIKDELDVQLGISFTGCTLNLATNIIDAQFEFDRPVGGAGPTPNNPVFVDAIGSSPIGFVISASLPGQQINQALPNPNFLIIAATPLVDTVTDFGILPVSSFNLLIPGRDISDFKNWYTEGDFVEFRAFSYNGKGQTQPLGSVTSAVEA